MIIIQLFLIYLTQRGYTNAVGGMCFQADLRYCMYVNDESQSMEQLRQMEPTISGVSWRDLPMNQPFLKPPECQRPLVPNAPNKCLARYLNFSLLYQLSTIIKSIVCLNFYQVLRNVRSKGTPCAISDSRDQRPLDCF